MDNHIYSFGGYCKKDNEITHVYSDVNVLDLQSRSWSHCQPLPCAVQESGVAVVGEDMLVIGGYRDGRGWLTQTYKYNRRTHKRTRCQDMPKADGVFQATVAVDSLVYVLAREMFQQYNVHADQWSKLPLPPAMERRHDFAMVHTQGCLLALGGYANLKDRNHPDDSVRSYNLSSKKWTLRKKKMPVAVTQLWAFTVLM